MKAPPAERYSWALGFNPPVAADRFAVAYRELGQQLGHAPEAADLVTAARARSHALHECFNWDRNAAAEAHWIDQAGRLIRNLRITFTTSPAREMPMRALFRVAVDGEKTWAATGVVIAEPDLQQQVLRDILADLRAFLGKYAVFLTAIGAEAQAQALLDAVAAALPA